MFFLAMPGYLKDSALVPPDKVEFEIEKTLLLPKIDKQAEETILASVNLERSAQQDENSKAMRRREIKNELMLAENDRKLQALKYTDTIKQKIQEMRRYPIWAVRNRVEGNVCLRFYIRSNGSINGVEIIKSSGSNILDNEAVSTIRRAAPFQAIPGDVNLAIIEIEITIVFCL